MTDKLTWDDFEDIGALLYETSPDTEPLTVAFTDLRDLVCDLDDFDDDPKACTEGKLEAIQMAWLEFWQDEQE
jgi:FeS assembly protein IscX